MGKTGGGRGTNGYQVKGRSVMRAGSDGRHAESDVTLSTPIRRPTGLVGSDIELLLSELDAAMTAAGIVGQIELVGGAALALAHYDRLSTTDVDGSIHPAPEITEIAAALACLVHGETPFLLPPDAPAPTPRDVLPPPRARTRDSSAELGVAPVVSAPAPAAPPVRADRAERGDRGAREPREGRGPAGAMTVWRLEVGWKHGVEPRNVIGALANEAGIPSRVMGRLEIRDFFSLIELPADAPSHVIEAMQRTWVARRQLRATPWRPDAPPRRSDEGGAEQTERDAAPGFGRDDAADGGRRAPKRRKI